MKRLNKFNKENYIPKFFRRFDFSHLDMTFEFESEYLCSTIIGIFFIFYIIIGLVIILLNFIPFAQHKNFSLQYYTQNLPKTENLYINNINSAFAFGLDCKNDSRTEMAKELFNITVKFIISRYGKNVYNETLKFHSCLKSDFNKRLFNFYDNLKLKNCLCLDKEDEFNPPSISGIYTDESFRYYTIGLSAKEKTGEHIDKINKFLLNNDCKLQFYATDIIMDLNDRYTPISYFIDSYFLQINADSYSKKNIFYMNYHLFDSKDVSFYNIDDYPEKPKLITGLSGIYDYHEFKGEDRAKKDAVFDRYDYAKIYLRAANRKIEVKRHYQNIMEFYADNSIVKDLFEICCFVLGILTTYLDRYSLAKRLFIFEDEKNENYNKINDIKTFFQNKSTIIKRNLKNKNNAGNIINNKDASQETNSQNETKQLNNNKQIIYNLKKTITSRTKILKRYNLTTWEYFIKWLCSCRKNNFEDTEGCLIEDSSDVIKGKFDACYYIKNMILLELIHKFELKGKKNLMNFVSIIPIFKSKKIDKKLINDSSQIENADLYKDWHELKLEKVKDEIEYLLEENKDPELLHYLKKKLLIENVNDSVIQIF